MVSRRTLWLTLYSLLVMSAGVSAHAQVVVPIPPLHTPSAEGLFNELRALPVRVWDKDESIILARTVSVNIKSVGEDVHGRHGYIFKELVGGRLAILETLFGPPVKAAFLNVENEAEPPLPNGFGSVEVLPIRWEELRPGRYLLVRLKAGVPSKAGPYRKPATYLGGPNDPVLVQYRRRLAWEAMPNQQRAHAEEETILLDPKTTLLARYAALWSRCSDIDLSVQSLGTARNLAARQELSHLLVRLLGQMRLPHMLREVAIKQINIDLSQPLVAGSDEALLARYLLHTAAYCPDAKLVRAAACQIVMLANHARGGMTKHGPQLYLFPDIVKTLQERAQSSDDAKCAQAAEAGLGSYARDHRVLPDTPYEKHVPFLTRSIPPFGSTQRERDLKMAAVTL